MWLLNVQTHCLEKFDDAVPKYAILSHTWGANEVSFQDLQRSPDLAFQTTKIKGCCQKAAKGGYGYVWIDTCCIDKTSSAELSEAINSMYSWYQKSEICYVYLADVSTGQDPTLPGSDFRKSRWFTRGWTLQELLAPTNLDFFDKEWEFIGRVTKSEDDADNDADNDEDNDADNDEDNDADNDAEHDADIPDLVSDITKIPADCIRQQIYVDNASIAQRMSWASGRKTTRVEDEAYCLLGIFDVNMPLLYGEGRKAFVRLQEEIIKASDDHSIFAWGYEMTTITNTRSSPFTTSVEDFRNCGMIETCSVFTSGHYLTTNKGLLIEMPVLELESGDFVGCINCGDYFTCMVIPLLQTDENVFHRYKELPPLRITQGVFDFGKPRQIYISPRQHSLPLPCGLCLAGGLSDLIEVTESYPQNWNLKSGEIENIEHALRDRTKDTKTIFLALTIRGIKIAMKIIYHFETHYIGSSSRIRSLEHRSVEFFFARMGMDDSLWKFIVEEKLHKLNLDIPSGSTAHFEFINHTKWVAGDFNFDKHYIVRATSTKQAGLDEDRDHLVPYHHVNEIEIIVENMEDT